MKRVRELGMITQHHMVGGYPAGTKWMVIERIDPVYRQPTLYLRHVGVRMYVGRLRCVRGRRRLSSQLARNGVRTSYRLESVALDDLEPLAGKPMFRSDLYDEIMQTINSIPPYRLDAWLSRHRLTAVHSEWRS